MSRPQLSARSRATLLAAVTLLLVVIGIVLVVTGGDDRPTGPSTTTTAAGTAVKPTLDVGDSSKDAVARLAGLSIPAGAADFLSASTEDRTQLDVTFTLPTDQEEAFVTGSGLPDLVPGDRVITHSSPLWKVNPEGRVSGASDVHWTIVRSVETVAEGDRIRVRIVLSPRG